MRAKQRLLRKLKKFFRRGEAGFAMIVVLVALLVISVLGAASLLLMVSSLHGIVNMKPEQMAFQMAESGLYVGHAMIVENKVSSETNSSGSLLGGNYSVNVKPKGTSTTNFTVTSTGTFAQGGTTYRRKIQEEVYYSGEQAYDALRNYIFFAGHNIDFYMPGQQNNYPVVISGNMRAENNFNLQAYCNESTWDYLVINGSIEARNSINIDAGGTYFYPNQSDFGMGPNPLDTQGVNVCLYGDIKAGAVDDTGTTGSVNLSAWSGDATLSGNPPRYTYVREGTVPTGKVRGITSLFAATDGASTIHEIHTTQADNLYTSKPNPPGHDKIYTGNHVTDRSVQKVYIPKPDFEYYKALAMEQDSAGDQHYFDVGSTGTATLPSNIKKTGISSMSVFYSTGDLKLPAGAVWQDEETNGIFVCEGTFTAVGEYELKKNCKFQVIAGGDVNMGKDATNRRIAGAVNQYFFYAKRDVNMCLTHFDENNLQATALRNINLYCDDNFSYANFNYQSPQVDVAAWPIDITVNSWKELPID
jgi:Tfp pilus assembly protein PilX